MLMPNYTFASLTERGMVTRYDTGFAAFTPPSLRHEIHEAKLSAAETGSWQSFVHNYCSYSYLQFSAKNVPIKMRLALLLFVFHLFVCRFFVTLSFIMSVVPLIVQYVSLYTL